MYPSIAEAVLLLRTQRRNLSPARSSNRINLSTSSLKLSPTPLDPLIRPRPASISATGLSRFPAPSAAPSIRSAPDSLRAWDFSPRAPPLQTDRQATAKTSAPAHHIP